MVEEIKISDDIITPSDLKTNIERVDKFGDIRILILYANLYNEHFINLLYNLHFSKNEFEKCDKCDKLKIPKFKQQVKKLAEINIIAKNYKQDELINLIFDLRNELVHKLVYEIKELEKRFDEFKPKDDETEIITKFLKNASSSEKIKLSVFATVTRLYQEYEKSFQRTPKETIHFEINPTGTEVNVVIKPY